MEKLRNLTPVGRVIAATCLSALSLIVLFGSVFLAVGLAWMPPFFVGIALFAALQVAVLGVFIESKKEAAR
ncbi:hypothetical protein ACFFUB_06735 [Algimonas porphyrae]|uniref:Uncharacterized protein n=1 Tax=Algimonas porphyrae TaxID=1128113 RepID=A0ABQ5V4D9_9PROT|nr:hypothetical protein [Algimonas porphyrae]GLQ21142.1 hypothetical protein GCM10007854_20970 [Algimonas porphyrae]